MNLSKLLGVSAILISSVVSGASLAQAQNLNHMSIEELISLDVTTVSKKSEKVSQAAAAVYVITAEDIRRSGVTSIPEALRLAPGVHVARNGSTRWAISIRGFNNVFANNLLVLIDGRTVYSPLFSGVFWDTTDTLIEDVKQIEVIRGPGAALWGANAVSGVINILTKDSKDTKGTLITAGGGTEELAFGSLRFGDEFGESSSYRVYGKGNYRDDLKLTEGGSSNDEWQSYRTGFRVDSDLTSDSSVFLSGDLYHLKGDRILDYGESQSSLFPADRAPNTEQNGANILGRWTKSPTLNSEIQLQMYYEYVDRDDGVIKPQRETFDIDFQHRAPLGDYQEITWGVNYRYTDDSLKTITPAFSFDPEEDDYHLYTAFIHDDIELVEDSLRLVLGSKFEENDFTGFEFQPNARLIWTPEENFSWWFSVSRAVHTPARNEFDSRTIFESGTEGSFGAPLFGIAVANRDFKAENVIAYETGVRKELTSNLLLDIAVFYNYHTDLKSAEIGEPQAIAGAEPRIELPFNLDNELSAESHGAELALEYRPMEDWRLVGTYTYLSINSYGSDTSDTFEPGGIPLFVEAQRINPEHQFSLRSLLNIANNIEFDSWIRFTDNFVNEIRNDGGREIGTRLDLDLRLGWHVNEELELSLIGQNLIEDSSLEWSQPLFGQPESEAERGVYLKLTLDLS